MKINQACFIFACCISLAACGGATGVTAQGPDPISVAPPLPSISDVKIQAWNSALSASQSHTISGNLSIIDNFPMAQLNKTRRIWIYLPAGYALSDEKYPVLYMQDGQNVFDTATSYAGEWGIDETMLQMEQQDPRLKTIVVGIDNGGNARSDEYLISGRAKEYVDFIVQSLKPYIDSQFRTLSDREHTAIGGSSYGAYVSLYAGLTRQNIFGKILAFSNVTIYDGGTLLNLVRQTAKQQGMRIYLDIGELENSQFPGVVDANQQMLNQLLAIGFARKN